jgi:hypothetical protein
MTLASYSLWEIVYSGVMHFVSSAFVGLLAYWLISTILRHGTEVLIFQRYSLRSLLSWSFAVFMAILFHVIIDWTTDWF